MGFLAEHWGDIKTAALGLVSLWTAYQEYRHRKTVKPVVQSYEEGDLVKAAGGTPIRRKP